MKIKNIGSLSQGTKVLPLLMLSLLLMSILLSSFHDHHKTTTVDHCPICSFQTSYSAVTFESTPDSPVFQKPLHGDAVSYNENITNPSQKLVNSSHAPPQFS